MRALKMRSLETGHWKLTTTNWEQLSKLILLQLHKKLLKNSSVYHSVVTQHLKQIGKVKKLDKWVPHELTADQKKSPFWSVLLSLYATTNHFSIGLDMQWKVDFIWQPVMASSVVRLRKIYKALSKAKLAPKRGHSYCLVVCCQSDPLQLSESQWNCYIWEVCSANGWDALKIARPAAGIDQQNGPNSSPQ